MRRLLQVASIAILAVALAASAFANPVTYYLEYTGSYPGLSASGTVTFDDSILHPSLWGVNQQFYPPWTEFYDLNLTVIDAVTPFTETITLDSFDPVYGEIVFMMSPTGELPPLGIEETTDFNLFDVYIGLGHYYEGVWYNTLAFSDQPIETGLGEPTALQEGELYLVTFTPLDQAAIPEPATLSLLALGGLALLRRRTRRP